MATIDSPSATIRTSLYRSAIDPRVPPAVARRAANDHRKGIRLCDLTAPVPSCPNWNLGQLLRHLGQLADALRAAGPDAEVWTPLQGETAEFLARRFAHEALIHRADAALVVDTDVAVDE